MFPITVLQTYAYTLALGWLAIVPIGFLVHQQIGGSVVLKLVGVVGTALVVSALAVIFIVIRWQQCLAC